MHFPRAAHACCGGKVIEDATEVIWRRSLGLSAGSKCEHCDRDGSYSPRNNLVLHELPPNLRCTPLSANAPGAARGRAILGGVRTPQELHLRDPTPESCGHNGGPRWGTSNGKGRNWDHFCGCC